MINLIQLRMQSGDEVICEVMEWPVEDGDQMIVRNAMVLTYTFDPEDMAQVYALKPWFTMIENFDEYIIINPEHVMGTAKPNSNFIDEYSEAVASMHNVGYRRTRETKAKTEKRTAAFMEALERIQNQIGTDTKVEVSGDSSTSNVIQFPTDTTVH